ncbi:MAG: cupin domain-containing protein [Candidatus Altiarchaeota archaeon]
MNVEVKKPKIVKKPWGREIWIANEQEYAGKILEIKRGFSTSLHYHKEKKETMYVLEGSAKIKFEKKDISLKEGQSIAINRSEMHKIIAITDLKILEVSTPQLDDVVRVMDDYGRV